MKVKVKICGITNLEDAKAAADAGADMLGFVFYEKSPRYITPEKAEEIISNLPAEVERIALFVNETKEHVKNILKTIKEIGILQFHGDETPEYCNSFNKRIIKAIRLKNISSAKQLEGYNVNFFLLDSFVEGVYGGSGRSFDWSIAKEVKKMYNVPIILSGGLNCENVKEAIEKVRPYAVDVSSGVEVSPGKKDVELVKKFIEEVNGR